MDLGPLELMYGWQALVCATACVGVTKLVKRTLDLTFGEKKRKANKWLSKVALPLSPVVVGALYAAFIPLRPEALLEYAATAELGGTMELLAFGGWGAACGQFSTMLHQKLSDFLGK